MYWWLIINTSKASFHIEIDCMYTVTTVSDKIELDKKQIESDPHFFLDLNEYNRILIPMKRKIFLLGGLFLIHQQYYPNIDFW